MSLKTIPRTGPRCAGGAHSFLGPMSVVDQRSAENIATLVPPARPWAEKFVVLANAALPAGYSVKIISGTRTYAEQDALFRKRPKVTNARGGQSNHNFGIAWDVGVFHGTTYLPESQYYETVGKVGKEMGLEWGGDWARFPDRPHFQIPVGKSVSRLDALVRQHGMDVNAAVSPLVHAIPGNGSGEVEVYEGGDKTGIRAFLESGRVWVAVRDFCGQFGGQVVSARGGKFTIVLNGDLMVVSGKTIDKTGYAMVADINDVLNWHLSYDPKSRRLVVTR